MSDATSDRALAGAPRPGEASEQFRWPAERPSVPPTAAPERGTSVERWGARLALAAGLAASLAIVLAPQPQGLSVAGQRGGAIFVLCTTLWVTHAIPFGVTGLLAVALLPLSGAMSAADAFASFGNSAVFFLIGVFILGGALVESGLSKRSALLFLRRFEGSPYAFANGMMLAAAFGTIWMPNQATTAMLFPIAVEVALALRLVPRESGYAKTLFLSLAWGAMVGSNASFLGSTRAALALGLLRSKYGAGISFLQWSVAAIPMVVLALAVAPLILRWLLPREVVSFRAARDLLEAQVREMGPLNRRQWTVAGIAILTIAGWVVFGDRIDLAVIALLGAAALFASGALSWEEAERRIFWNIVLMYGGAIALGAVIERTGAAEWLIGRYAHGLQAAPLVAIALVLLGSLLLSEFMSNAAAVAVMLPLAFGLGDALGVSPTALTLATTIGAGLDFALPFSSAPNTIAFSSGYLRMSDVLKAGTVMTIASVLVVLLVAWLWWPILGVI